MGLGDGHGGEGLRERKAIELYTIVGIGDGNRVGACRNT